MWGGVPLGNLLKNGGGGRGKASSPLLPAETSLYLAGTGAGGRGQAEYKTGYRLEVHPYNIYYWRRMNHFPIYGPLAVEGRSGGGGEISLTRRNIYVLLKDVLMDWQRYRQGLPALLSSPLGDLSGHWSSLAAWMPGPVSAIFQLNLNVSSAQGREGAIPREEGGDKRGKKKKIKPNPTQTPCISR